MAGLCSASAWADCSRVIVVPAAPTGFNVKVTDDLVTGVYPDWLREVGRRSGCTLQFPVVPRARADSMLFVYNQSDMLLPASQNAEYDTLVRDLIAENRVDFVNDLETIGRMLRAGRADFTILPPTLLYSALQLDSAGIQTMWWPQTSAPTELSVAQLGYSRRLTHTAHQGPFHEKTQRHHQTRNVRS